MKNIIVTYVIIPLIIAILAALLLYGWLNGNIHWGKKYIILPEKPTEELKQ
jgi:hypothetical protein